MSYILLILALTMLNLHEIDVVYKVYSNDEIYYTYSESWNIEELDFKYICDIINQLCEISNDRFINIDNIKFLDDKREKIHFRNLSINCILDDIQKIHYEIRNRKLKEIINNI